MWRFGCFLVAKYDSDRSRYRSFSPSLSFPGKTQESVRHARESISTSQASSISPNRGEAMRDRRPVSSAVDCVRDCCLENSDQCSRRVAWSAEPGMVGCDSCLGQVRLGHTLPVRNHTKTAAWTQTRPSRLEDTEPGCRAPHSLRRSGSASPAPSASRNTFGGMCR
jgi:hypothetical protein